jgi:hypothetical protein
MVAYLEGKKKWILGLIAILLVIVISVIVQRSLQVLSPNQVEQVVDNEKEGKVTLILSVEDNKEISTWMAGSSTEKANAMEVVVTQSSRKGNELDSSIEVERFDETIDAVIVKGY